MKKNLLFFLLLNFMIAGSVYAQKENNIWAFGDKAGIDFNSGTATAFANNMATESGCASVANRFGSLLFYTSGLQVWDRNNNLMPNGTGLIADTYAMQKAVIVPFINDTNRFYVFHLQSYVDFFSPSLGSLYYSVVDMTLNGGLGDIVPGQKNISVWNSNIAAKGLLGGGMVAVPGENCNVWLVTHITGDATGNSNVFKVFEITEAGVNTAPVSSQTGNITGPVAYLTTVIKASPDYHKLATTTFTQGYGPLDPTAAELHDFDPATGIVSNSVVIDSTSDLFFNILSVEFSPDGSKLYTSAPFAPLMVSGGGGVFQFDLSLPTLAAIQASKTIVSNAILVGDLARAPDNKIYVSYFTTGSPSVDRIDNPNIAGTASTYTLNALGLSTGTVAKVMLPTPVVYPLQDTTFRSRDTIMCKGASLTLNAPGGFLHYFWQDVETGDTTSTVNSSGTYWVTYENHCMRHTDTIQVTYYDFDSGLRDTGICGDTFDYLIQVSGNNPAGTAYQWQDGSQGPALLVNAPGTYWVKMNLDGCEETDTVRVQSKAIPKFSFGPDPGLCSGDELELECPLLADSYLWQDGSTARSLSVNSEGPFIVQATRDGCTGSDTVGVVMKDCNCKLLVPNAFSPNADGLNDDFKITLNCGSFPVKFRVSIYNRWGQRVFYSNKPDYSWDGKVNGGAADVGTYSFIIEYEDRKGNPFVKRGDLVLIQ